MDAVIPQNSAPALSGIIDLQDAVLVGFIMPAAWTTANLSFQAARSPGDSFRDVYTTGGTELVVVAAASRAIVDIPELASVRYLKIRAGTSAAPVAQTGNRTISLMVK